MSDLSNLYRAIVESRTRDRCAVVFFESPVERDRLDHVEGLMALAWNVPTEDLEIYNLYSADELFGGHCWGDESDGDLRLFQTGWSMGEALYANPAETLVLVASQALHDRLVAAQMLIPDRTRLVTA